MRLASVLVTFGIPRVSRRHAEEPVGLRPVDLDAPVRPQGENRRKGLFPSDVVPGTPVRLHVLLRVLVVLLRVVLVIRAVDVPVKYVVKDAEMVDVQVSVHDKTHRAGFPRVCLVEDRLDILLVHDGHAVSALEALVREHDAGIRRSDDRGAHPFQLLRRDPVDRRSLRALEIVAPPVVDELPGFVAEVIGIRNHEAEATLVKGVVSVGHPVRLARLLVRIAVLIVVAEAVVARYLEVVVELEKRLLLRRAHSMQQIAAMDHHVASFAFGARHDLLKKGGVFGIRPRSRMVVEVGEHAHLERPGGRRRAIVGSSERRRRGKGGNRQELSTVHFHSVFLSAGKISPRLRAVLRT